jgi:hypothetical protein
MKQRVTAPNKKKSARKKSSKAPSRKSVKRRKPSAPEPQEFPISHAMLRAMYDAMVESRLWAQSRKLIPVISEATAVASAAVLHAGDSLAAPADGRTLYPVTDRRAKIMPLDASKLRLACEKARRSRRGTVVAVFPSDVFDAPIFQELLSESVNRRWPLVCVLLSDRYCDPAAAIPEIDVDGHDVVAMFRVVSESVRRARNRRGPAVIHAHNSTDTQHPDPLGDPLVRFQRYLEAKGLTTQRLHVVHKNVPA